MKRIILISFVFLLTHCNNKSVNLSNFSSDKFQTGANIATERLKKAFPAFRSFQVVEAENSEKPISNFLAILFSEDKKSWIVNPLGDDLGILHVSFSQTCTPSKLLVFSKGFEPSLFYVNCNSQDQHIPLQSVGSTKRKSEKLTPWVQASLKEIKDEKISLPVVVLLKTLTKAERDSQVGAKVRNLKIKGLDAINTLALQSPATFALELSRNFPDFSLRLIQLESFLAYLLNEQGVFSAQNDFTKVASFLLDKNFRERLKTLKVALSSGLPVRTRSLASIEIPNLFSFQNSDSTLNDHLEFWRDTGAGNIPMPTSSEKEGKEALQLGVVFKELYQAFLSENGKEYQKLWNELVQTQNWQELFSLEKNENSQFKNLKPFLNHLALAISSEKTGKLLPTIEAIFKSKASAEAIIQLYEEKNRTSLLNATYRNLGAFPSLAEYSEVISYPKQALFFEFLSAKSLGQDKSYQLTQDFAGFPAFSGNLTIKAIRELSSSPTVLKIYPQFEALNK